MAYTFDGSAKTITLSVGTTSLDAQDLYSRWKDWVLEGNANWTNAFTAVGGDDLGSSVSAGDYYFLQDDWVIVPQDADHVLAVTGNIYPATPGASMFGTRAGRNIQILLSRSSLTQTIAVGSGVTPSDVTDIATAARDAILDDGTRFSGANIDAAVSSLATADDCGLTEDQATILTQLQTLTAELHRLAGLEIGTALAVTATTRTAGAIFQTITEDGGTVTVERT